MSNFNPEELRLGRLRRRLSQGELANLIGLSKSTLCRIERAEKDPSPEEVQAIASALLSIPDKLGSDTDRRKITELAVPRRQLRIEIGVEEILASVERRTVHADSTGQNAATTSKIVLFVPLDAFDEEVSESDDLRIQYPRAR